MSREIAHWELSHWAGTLKQLEKAAQIAVREVRALVPFPEGYDPDASGNFDREQHQRYLAAESAHALSVTINEAEGYTSHLDTLDEMIEWPSHKLSQIDSIGIDVGQGQTRVEIRLRHNGGMRAEVSGGDRNWVAGLRHQLEDALNPRFRLHAPFGSEPINLAIPGAFGFSVVFIGIDQALYYGAHWSTKTGRVLISFGLGLLWAVAFGTLGWASAKRSEVLSEDELPRYERWRRRVLGWTGTVILAVIGTALYSVIAG